MAEALNQQHRMITIGGHSVALELWKIERLADDTFEYHAYVGHNFNQNDGTGNPKVRLSRGAVFQIFRITDPGAVEETFEFYMGRTLLEAADDALTLAWADRTNLPYVRYDQVLKDFFT